MLWEKDDSLASLAVIGCLCMEAILSDYRFCNAFYIPLLYLVFLKSLV